MKVVILSLLLVLSVQSFARNLVCQVIVTDSQGSVDHTVVKSIDETKALTSVFLEKIYGANFTARLVYTYDRGNLQAHYSGVCAEQSFASICSGPHESLTVFPSEKNGGQAGDVASVDCKFK